MKPIGGYLELELNDFNSLYHDEAYALNTGRNSFEFILKNSKLKKIFIPYYTCDVILQPFKRLKIEYEFYMLNEIFLPELKALQDDEALVYVNYFGIMNNKVQMVVEKFKNVIIDNSQAFFAKQVERIPTFYSPRKFFGLPDGGFAYVNLIKEFELNQDQSFDRLTHLIQRIENGAEYGYKYFKLDNEKLNNKPILKMSELTRKLLKNINFINVKKERNNNFQFIHRAIGAYNELEIIIDEENIDGAMVYPFLRKGNEKLKKILIDKKVFVATYWPNVNEWVKEQNSFESYLVKNLIPIPIDQRYKDAEMEFIIEIIKEYINK